MNVDRKIVIITTRGCLGCSVQSKNVDEAIEQYRLKYRITKEVKDFKKVNRSILNRVDAKDFPVTLFMVDNDIRFKCVGSYPAPVIARWIMLYMK